MKQFTYGSEIGETELYKITGEATSDSILPKNTSNALYWWIFWRKIKTKQNKNLQKNPKKFVGEHGTFFPVKNPKEPFP